MEKHLNKHNYLHGNRSHLTTLLVAYVVLFSFLLIASLVAN